MKCFTLKSLRLVRTTTGGIGSGAPNVSIENYPPADLGIELTASDRCLVIGGEIRIPASKELLALPPETDAISRDGTRVTVFRAGIERIDGQLKLVPERPEDAGQALVLVDIGGGRYGNLRFQATDGQMLARQCSDDLRLHDEKLLAVLKPFEPLTALRSSRKWVFWGEERLRERLPIKYDGERIFYEVLHS